MPKTAILTLVFREVKEQQIVFENIGGSQGCGQAWKLGRDTLKVLSIIGFLVNFVGWGKEFEREVGHSRLACASMHSDLVCCFIHTLFHSKRSAVS